ncbi:MAG: metallophosphatase family protein [Symbiobacteriaceae bacterium]|nr:MAG: metallophosphoesterase [Bacillota bacterium]
MRIAIISDIHGNLPALEAVLADIDRRSASAVFCLGDVCFKGPHAAECVDLLRRRGIPTVRGNTDRYLAGAVPGEIPEQARALLDPWREALGEERLAWLRDLPGHIEETVDGIRVLLVHGSPRSDEEPILPWPVAGPGPNGAPVTLEEVLAGVTASVVCFGHHHLQLAWRHGDRLLLGPGSVGMPFDGDPRAAYALLEADPEGGRAELSLVRVRYDVDAAIAAHRRLGFDKVDPGYGAVLRAGRPQPSS